MKPIIIAALLALTACSVGHPCRTADPFPRKADGHFVAFYEWQITAQAAGCDSSAGPYDYTRAGTPACKANSSLEAAVHAWRHNDTRTAKSLLADARYAARPLSRSDKACFYGTGHFWRNVFAQY